MTIPSIPSLPSIALPGAGVSGASAPAGSAYETAVLADSPYLYWRLGESAGTTATDSSGNSRSGTYNGALVLGQAGALTGDADTAVRWPAAGTGLFVSRADEAGLTFNGASGYSLECWAKWSTGAAVRAYEALLTKGDTSWRLGRDNATTNLNFVYDGSNFVATTAGVPFDGNWHHIVCVYDRANTDAFVYIDGVARGTNTAATGTAPPDNANPFYVGENAGATGRCWQGWIDEVALYAAPLSAARVSAHYTAGTT